MSDMSVANDLSCKSLCVTLFVRSAQAECVLRFL